jgi:hypothetical protein
MIMNSQLNPKLLSQNVNTIKTKTINKTNKTIKKKTKCIFILYIRKFTYNNLMWDKRVVRGNTYAAIVTSKNV